MSHVFAFIGAIIGLLIGGLWGALLGAAALGISMAILITIADSYHAWADARRQEELAFETGAPLFWERQAEQSLQHEARSIENAAQLRVQARTEFDAGRPIRAQELSEIAEHMEQAAKNEAVRRKDYEVRAINSRKRCKKLHAARLNAAPGVWRASAAPRHV